MKQICSPPAMISKGPFTQIGHLVACEFLTFSPRKEYRSPQRERPTSLRRGEARRHGAHVRSIGSKTQATHWLAQPYNSYLRRRARGREFVCTAALLLAVYFLMASRTVHADYPPTEYQVKAAYLLNFLKFVEWPGTEPADPRGKWVIGFIGNSPVGAALALLAEEKSVGGHELLVKKFRVTDNLRECNILFVSASEEKHLPTILHGLEGSSVLTVADLDNFIVRGGMIQLLTEGDRVRVNIDLGATSRAHLKVSSKLLALAEAVTETARSAHN